MELIMKRTLQIRIDEKTYQQVRKMAYKEEMTVNKMIVKIVEERLVKK